MLLEVGEACQPYQPIIRLVDTSRCYFVSNLEARLAARLKADQSVKLEVETGAAPVTVTGKLIFISPVVDPGSGLVRIRVLFENREGKVRPGLTAKMLLE
jgi:multidrug efflux pump subunit AcrA (membrane-fusion protein)